MHAIGDLYSVHQVIVRDLVRRRIQVKSIRLLAVLKARALPSGCNVRTCRLLRKIRGVQVLVGVSPTCTLGQLKSTFIILIVTI